MGYPGKGGNHNAVVSGTDASLLDRSHHTGTQPVSSLSDFTAQVNTFVHALETLMKGGVAEDGDTLNKLNVKILALQALTHTENINLDTVPERIAALQGLQATLDTILVDDLTTGGATKALTATQGVALKALIDDLDTAIQHIPTFNPSTVTGSLDSPQPSQFLTTLEASNAHQELTESIAAMDAAMGDVGGLLGELLGGGEDDLSGISDRWNQIAINPANDTSVVPFATIPATSKRHYVDATQNFLIKEVTGDQTLSFYQDIEFEVVNVHGTAEVALGPNFKTVGGGDITLTKIAGAVDKLKLTHQRDGKWLVEIQGDIK